MAHLFPPFVISLSLLLLFFLVHIGLNLVPYLDSMDATKKYTEY